MSRARHILAVVAVTTALCANHVVSAAPLPRPHVTEMAARFVGRFSATFRRPAPRAIRTPDRFQVVTVQTPVVFKPVCDGAAFQREFSPFQFRLPPPIL
jgi:hypothetical protein